MNDFHINEDTTELDNAIERLKEVIRLLKAEQIHGSSQPSQEQMVSEDIHTAASSPASSSTITSLDTGDTSKAPQQPQPEWRSGSDGLVISPSTTGEQTSIDTAGEQMACDTAGEQEVCVNTDKDPSVETAPTAKPEIQKSTSTTSSVGSDEKLHFAAAVSKELRRGGLVQPWA